MIRITQRGDFSKTEEWLSHAQTVKLEEILDKYGEIGVSALADATPRKYGETANSWYYEIVQRRGYISLRFRNSYLDEQGTPVAVLIQYGHGTKNGGYVSGYDYINPVMQPIFDQIEEECWREVIAHG